MTGHARITGRLGTLDGQQALVLERHFAAHVQTVWEHLVVSDRLALWFGTWAGDPASGRVDVTWSVEEGAPAVPYGIEACEAPTHLALVTLDDPHMTWRLDIALAEQGGGTRFVFTQPLDEKGLAMLGDLGAGWEYYLDRLAQALETGVASTIEWGSDYTDLTSDYAALTA